MLTELVQGRPPKGALVVVHGPPGSGKTALALSVLAAATRTATVALVDCEASPRSRLVGAARSGRPDRIRYARAATSAELARWLRRAEAGLGTPSLAGCLIDGALTPTRFDRDWSSAWRALHGLRHRTARTGAWAVATVGTSQRGTPVGGVALEHLATVLVRIVPQGANAGILVLDKGGPAERLGFAVRDGLLEPTVAAPSP